jgi:hypothetical protein
LVGVDREVAWRVGIETNPACPEETAASGSGIAAAALCKSGANVGTTPVGRGVSILGLPIGRLGLADGSARLAPNAQATVAATSKNANSEGQSGCKWNLGSA